MFGKNKNEYTTIEKILRRMPVAISLMVIVFFVAIPLASAEGLIWEKKHLTDNGYYDGRASISNDGFRIAFLRGNLAFNDIHRIRCDGTGELRLVQGTSPYYCWEPSISGDGSKIFFVQDSHLVGPPPRYAPVIGWVSWDGTQTGGISQPTSFDPNWLGNRYPSPDDSGSSVVYHSWDVTDNDWEIYLTDTNGYTQITNNNVHDAYPSISGDGTRIVWQTYDSLNGDLDIYGAESPSWTPIPLSEGSSENNNLDDEHPSISGDGTRVVWQAKSARGDWDIWGVTWGTSVGNPVRKAGNGANGDDTYPRINHGGWQITYQSNEGSPSYDIWIVDWEGTGRRRLTGPDNIPDERPTKRGDRLGGCTIAYEGPTPGDLDYELWALNCMLVGPEVPAITPLSFLLALLSLLGLGAIAMRKMYKK